MDNAQYVRTLKDLKVKLERLQKKKFKDQTKVLNNELLVLKYKNKIHKIVSKNLFGDENKLTDLESKLGKISNGVVLPSKVYSKCKHKRGHQLCYNLSFIVVRRCIETSKM